MYNPSDPSASTASSSGGSAAGNTRYAYLVQRLRTRQVTMEEATELFGLMQGMLRASEQARLLAVRSTAATPSLPAPSAPRVIPPPPPAGGSNVAADDFLLMGFLMMGAGAGLLAALTKRIQDAPGPPAPRPASGDPAR